MTTFQDTKIAETLQPLAAAVDRILENQVGQKVFFSILVWAEEGKSDRFQYVSNVPREDVKRCMEEALKKWGRQFQ